MMRSPSRLLATLAVAALAATPIVAQAQAAATAATPVGTFAVKCGTLLVGDGSAPKNDVWLVVRDGKIESISQAAPPSDLAVVDASTKVVMPGIVAVDTDLAVVRDSEYQITPDALAIDAFDFERSWRRALEGGITSAYVSPGRLRLVSGQGAVVKLAGSDIIERVLSENAALRVNFSDTAMRAPRVFEPDAHPTDENPLVPARIQTPTSRISLLAELRAIFAAATDKDETASGQGPEEHQYDERALRSVIGGTMPMRAAAANAQDIRRALMLQKELGIKMVLENPSEIARVAKAAAGQNVMATFRVPALFGRSVPGGEDRLREMPTRHFDAPAKAAAAGLTIGLSPAAGVPLRDYLMSVAIAVRHGLTPEAAMKAIGLDAAKILGVDKRVGSLEKGKDADFVVLSGAPLAIGSMVESTWIDGQRRYTRKTDSQVLAVRTKRVHDGTGRVLRNGVILIQNGRIKAVGEDLTIPYGAEVIDLDGVATPGFIDVFSHLGLAGEGSGVPSGNPGQRLHEVIATDDPMFEPALREGITSLLVAGKDGSLSSGRLTAIKTGAQDREGLVLRAVAGQRMVHDAIGPNSAKPLADLIARARKYADTWAKYEKALYEWKTGKTPPPEKKPEEKKPEPEKEEAKQPKADPLTGTWEAEITIQERFTLQIKLNLELKGEKVTGTIQIGMGRGGAGRSQDISGTFTNGTLKIEFSGMGGSATLEATVKDDTMTGKLTLGPMGSQDVTGTRTSKKPGAAPKRSSPRRTKKKDDDGRPKPPKTDENLEPLRAVLAGKASIVVRCNRGPAISAIVEVLEKEKISYLLTGCDDLLDDPSLLDGNKPGIVIGPEVVVDDNGKLVNVPSTFADQGLKVLFGSGNCEGTQFLPLHVAYAVRYGLSPQDALKGLTLWAAEAFHLEDRVGSLEKGKDADLVVFSGNPFEPQSRVLLVVCNGRVVVDNREEVQ